MILEEETFKKFGYYPQDLTPRSSRKILAICDDCGKIRETTKHDYGIRCRSCANKVNKVEKNQSICRECGIAFETYPSDIKRGHGIFCSRKCSDKWKIGKSCHKNLKSGKSHHRWKGGRTEQICQQCGKVFKIYLSCTKRNRGKFCSRKCKGIWQSENTHGKNSPHWQGGISFEPYCQKFNNEFKEYIRNKFDRVCFLCQKTERENGRKLSVHHVNYNKGCGCDNDGTCQFVPLCISCNSKVNKNRSEWETKIKAKMRNKLNGWYI